MVARNDNETGHAVQRALNMENYSGKRLPLLWSFEGVETVIASRCMIEAYGADADGCAIALRLRGDSRGVG
jgi:hypothetical protein